MKITALGLEGLKLVEFDVFEDSRGHFVERFNERAFIKQGLPTHFVQDNFSLSCPGVLRGLHCQRVPSQGKLVSVLQGAIFDAVVDARAESASIGQRFTIELKAGDGRALWIPSGFLHGFCVLGTTPALVTYKVDEYFNPAADAGVHWADPELNIPWPVKVPILSNKDSVLPSFSDFLAVRRKAA